MNSSAPQRTISVVLSLAAILEKVPPREIARRFALPSSPAGNSSARISPQNFRGWGTPGSMW